LTSNDSRKFFVTYEQKWGSRLENFGSVQQVFGLIGDEIAASYVNLKIEKISKLQLSGGSLIMFRKWRTGLRDPEIRAQLCKRSFASFEVKAPGCWPARPTNHISVFTPRRTAL
jgi:hypothetical protein